MKHLTIVFSKPENQGQNRSKPKTKSSKYKIPDCTCDICGKVVKGRATLKLHKMAVHENLKPHVCDRCGQKYVRKAKLNEHVKNTHEKEQRYKCEQCDKTFSWSTNLKNHIEAIHIGKLPN